MTKQKKEEAIPDDLITLQDAAALRGYADVSAMSRLIERGRVRVFEKYGRKLVSRAEVSGYRPSKGGRPKTEKGSKK